MDIPRAYLLGYHLGDGCLTAGPRNSMAVRYTDCDLDALNLIRAILLCEFDSKVGYKVLHGRNAYEVASTKRNVCDWIEKWVGRKRFWPNEVFLWAREAKIAFFAGLMDSDGFVGIQRDYRYFSKKNNAWYVQPFRCLVGFCNTSDWIVDVMRLANQLGIETGKLASTMNSGNGPKRTMPIRKVYFTPKSFISSGMFFFIKKKQTRLEEIGRWYNLRVSSETIRAALWLKPSDDIVRSA